jgi:hypothetical protein
VLKATFSRPEAGVTPAERTVPPKRSTVTVSPVGSGTLTEVTDAPLDAGDPWAGEADGTAA